MSCISIDTQIKFKTDTSGEVSITYNISREILDIGKIDKEDSFSPLPVEEKQYMAIAEKTDGLELKSYKIKESETETIISIIFDFNNIDSLNSAVYGNSNETMINVKTIDGQTLYSQIIYDGREDLSFESRDILISMFDDKNYTLTVIAPETIKETNMGKTSGKTAENILEMSEILSSDSPVIWEITW